MPFPVSCPACGKSFSIADDAYEQKIKGRVVSVKCKQCQALIRVDGTRPLDVARRPSNSPAEPPPAFLVDTPGGTDRELDANQIAIEIREGRMTEATLVWREGMAEWTEAGKVPELQPFLKPVSLSVPAPAAPAAEPARKIRPMQPTLPMGMMAPPSLAARGITLPLNPPAPAAPPPPPPPAPAVAEDTETRRLPAVDEAAPAAPDDGFDALFGPSAAPAPKDEVVTSVAPAPPEASKAARGSAPRAGSSPRAASSPMAAPAPGSAPAAAARPPSAPRAAGPAPKPASAPRASALPLPTPLPRPAAPPPAAPAPDVDRPSFEPQPYMAPSAFPAQATAPLPPTHPLQSAYPTPAQFPGNGQRVVGSTFPTAPAPPGTMPQESFAPGHPGPLPHSLAPALPGTLPQSLSPALRTAPLPDSFPAAARLDDLEFQPKRGKGVYIAIGVVALAVIGAIVAASSGDDPKPVPVPTITPTAEPAAPTPTPAPTPSPTAPSDANPLGGPAAPSLPGTPPRTGSEFTDLFAAGAKKLEGKPAPSATAPTPPPSPLTPPPQ